MQMDTWYDLALRELSDLMDPAKEKLTEAEASSPSLPEIEKQAQRLLPRGIEVE